MDTTQTAAARMNIPDWDRITERLRAWYEFSIADRMPILIRRAPRPEELPPAVDRPATSEARCWDPAYRAGRIQAALRATRCWGEAMPYAPVAYGTVFFALFWGARAAYAEQDGDRLWLHETVEDWRGHPPLRFDPQDRYFRMSAELIERLARDSRGEYLTSPAWSNSCGDVLVALRGNEPLALDLYDDPEEILRRAGEFQAAWQAAMREYFARVSPYQAGHMNWWHIWAPDTNTILGCDFCSILSPKHFERFFLPELAAQARFIKYPLYHLDGRGELPHLDALLEIPGLRGIQWSNDDFTDRSQLQHVHFFKKILAKKKTLTIEVEPRHAEAIVRELGREGLLLSVPVSNEAEAEAMLRLASDC